MERSGSTAPSVRHLDDLARILRHSGPFVTVCASRPGFVPNAVSSRVRSVRDSAHAIASDGLVEQLVEAVGDAMPHSAGVLVVADQHGVALRIELDDPPEHEFTRVGAVPSLVRAVEQRQREIPFVLVVADRRGAELYWSDAEHDGTTKVERDEPFIRKVQAGGWSHRRFQQRAENNWEHLAVEIAAELSRRVELVAPRIVALAGDLRMCEILRKRLPPAIVERLRDVPGSRSDDGSDDDREASVERWIRAAVSEDTVAVLELFEQERGQSDRASEGIEATLAALREGRVDVLLVHDDGDEAAEAFFVPDEPSLVATDANALTNLGHQVVLSARAVDVALRAAVLSGAGVRVVPRTQVPDGIGAILRW
jgi:hypothetical protein